MPIAINRLAFALVGSCLRCVMEMGIAALERRYRRSSDDANNSRKGIRSSVEKPDYDTGLYEDSGVRTRMCC